MLQIWNKIFWACLLIYSIYFDKVAYLQLIVLGPPIQIITDKLNKKLYQTKM